MSTISRRTFLKLAGVTAVATAGASMLTGCSRFDDVELVIMGSIDDGKTYTKAGSKSMPRILVNTVKGNLKLALDLVKKYGPEEYRGADVTVDKDYPNCLTFVKDKETGKESMIIAVKVAMVEVEYEVLVNGKSVTSGKHSFPKGVTGIDEDTARKIIAEVAKNNDKVPANYEFDSTVADNLKVVNGKITVALKVAAADPISFAPVEGCCTVLCAAAFLRPVFHQLPPDGAIPVLRAAAVLLYNKK